MCTIERKYFEKKEGKGKGDETKNGTRTRKFEDSEIT